MTPYRMLLSNTSKTNRNSQLLTIVKFLHLYFHSNYIYTLDKYTSYFTDLVVYIHIHLYGRTYSYLFQTINIKYSMFQFTLLLNILNYDLSIFTLL